nr:MAG: putative capsid protein [Arizlama virus]
MSQKPKRMWTGSTFGAAVAASRKREAQSKFIKMATGRVARLPYQQAPLARRGGSSQEVKSFDVQVAGGALTALNACAGAEPAAAWAGITEVNCIRQDATVAGRIGNKVVIKSIHCKFNVNTIAGNLGAVRVMLVYDKQPNGAFPAIADVILDQPAAVTQFFSSLNIANKSRFQVIRDSFMNLDSGQGLIKSCNWYSKGRWETEFGANAGTIGDFRTGAIYLIAAFTSAASSMASVCCRVRYYD